MIKTNKNEHDLEERTAKFAENIILFCKDIKTNLINIPIISQLIRSSTSIGANYYEATGAMSKLDFKNKIFICKKESIETKFWLRMIAKSNPETTDKARTFWKEVQELTLIFSKIGGSLKNNK